MAISQVTVTDKIKDQAGKYNDTCDEIQVSGVIASNNILRLSKFDGSTVDIQLPYSEDKILSGLVVTITYGPTIANVSAGQYQLEGLTFIVGAVGFPVVATSSPILNRIDLIVGDNTGSLIYVSGTEAAIPTPPIQPPGTILISGLYVSGLGTVDTYVDVSSLSPGTIIGSGLKQDGAKQIENTFFNQNGTLTNINNNNILFSWNDLTNRYELNYNKTGISGQYENIPTGKTAGYYFDNNYQFLIESVIPTVQQTKIDNRSNYLDVNHEDLNTSIKAQLILDGINAIAELSVTGNGKISVDQNRHILEGGQIVDTTTVSGVYNVLTEDHIILCNTSGGAVTVNLPASPAGTIYIIKDFSGNAFTNNITIDGNGGDTIDGSLTHIINQNYSSRTLVKSGGSTWSII